MIAIEVLAELVRPPESVTEAVIVWLPADSPAVEKDPPDPITPLMFEVHVRLVVRLPSSASAAVPLNLIVSPTANELPAAGAVITVAGG